MSPLQPETEDVCYICLDLGEEPVIRPCACTALPVHQTCLARWQLQSAGKEEERACRFCKAPLPSWKTAFSDMSGEAVPVMSIQFKGLTYWLEVKPGDGGVEQFKEDVRRLLGLNAEQAFDITFECRVPGADSRMELQGLHAYDAAVYCASLSAARRQSECSNTNVSSNPNSSKGSQWGRSRASSSSGGGLARGSAEPAVAGTPSSSVSSSNAEARGFSGSSSVDSLDLAVRPAAAKPKFCLASKLLEKLRLLWQPPEDLMEFC